jgi:hypothetical protein
LSPIRRFQPRIYRGSASAALTASVTMTRLERTDPAAIARS